MGHRTSPGRFGGPPRTTFTKGDSLRSVGKATGTSRPIYSDSAAAPGTGSQCIAGGACPETVPRPGRSRGGLASNISAATNSTARAPGAKARHAVTGWR